MMPNPELHVRINSGIKLLNCLGFGIPSICPDEPAYAEMGDGCTLITDVEGCPAAVERLKADRELYRKMKDRCFARSQHYHVDKVVGMYRDLIESL